MTCHRCHHPITPDTVSCPACGFVGPKPLPEADALKIARGLLGNVNDWPRNGDGGDAVET